MVSLCCTQALLKQIGARAQRLTTAPTNALGNWYANIIVIHRRPVIIAVSERAFVPALFPAQQLREQLVPSFHRAVSALLVGIGAAASVIERERALMSHTVIAPTASRQVLGVMNQYVLEVRFFARYNPGVSLPGVALHMASGLAGPLGLARPQEAALELLQSHHAVM